MVAPLVWRAIGARGSEVSGFVARELCGCLGFAHSPLSRQGEYSRKPLNEPRDTQQVPTGSRRFRLVE